MVLSKSKGGKGISLLKTAEDYASHTTIHGVSYAFDKDLSVPGRILWAIIVVALLALASYLTFNTWEDWRDDQVIPFHALSSFKPYVKGGDNFEVFFAPNRKHLVPNDCHLRLRTQHE